MRPGSWLMCTSVIGFGVRKSAKARKVVFFVRRVVGGKDHRVTLGSHAELSVREARKLAKAKIVEIDRCAVREVPSHDRGSVGEVPGRAPTTRQAAPSTAPLSGPVTRPAGTQAPDPRMDEILALLRARGPVASAAPAVLTLGELWDRVGPGWLARLKPETAKNIRTLFTSRVLPRWSTTPVDEIRNANLSKWYESFLESAPHYGANATKKVIQLLRLGHEQEQVASLPVFKIRFVAPKRRTPLNKDAIRKLVQALEAILIKDRLHSNANAIISIMNTGERATAGLQLHTREVNYEKKCITKSRKFDQVKTLPISDYAAKFLRSIHPRGGGYFFPNKRDPSQPIKYGALLAFLKQLCAKHGILAVDGSIPTIHCMRHTYATLLEERGLPVSHIQRLMGHSCIQSTLRYIHGSEAAAREGANLLKATRVRVGRRTR